MSAATGEPPVRCADCGQTPTDQAAPAWLWSRQIDDAGREHWLCPDCVRRHSRSIEAKLDREWW